MSSRELTELEAFYEIDPWGEQRADMRNALLCAAIVNANRGRKRRATHPKTFMLYPDKGARVTDPQDMMAMLKAIFPPQKKKGGR